MDQDNINLQIGRILEHQHESTTLMFELIDLYLEKLKTKEIIGEDRERLLFFLNVSSKQLELYFKIKDVYIELTQIMLDNPNLFNNDKEIQASSASIFQIINNMTDTISVINSHKEGLVVKLLDEFSNLKNTFNAIESYESNRYVETLYREIGTCGD